MSQIKTWPSIGLLSSKSRLSNSRHTSKMVRQIKLFTTRLVLRELWWTDDTIYDHQFAPEDVLGLDHVDKSGKTRTGAAERAIVIRG